MSEALFTLSGKMVGQDYLIRAVNKAPKLYYNGVKGWLLSTMKSFVGDKKSQGIFRKRLAKLTTIHGTPWDNRMINLFRGLLENDQWIDMRLRMGLLYNTRKKVHEILEFMSSGGGTIKSSKLMPVPVYKNLGTAKKPYQLFKSYLNRGKFGVAYVNGKAFYFDKGIKRDRFSENHNVGGKNLLMFVGVKNVTIKKKIPNFEAMWRQNLPKYTLRGQQRIDRISQKVQEMSRG